jgi:hypothetical protein
MTSTEDGVGCSASRLGLFTSGEIPPGTHWIGDWVDRTLCLDIVEKRKTLHYWISSLGRPVPSPRLYRLNYPY